MNLYCTCCGYEITEEMLKDMKNNPTKVFLCPDCDAPLSLNTSKEVV